MQVSKIAIACSLAFAAMSAQAVPTNIPANPANVVFISGASGVDSYLNATASNLLNVTSYVHSADNNYRAYYGTTKAAIGALPAGSNLLIVKRSAGGSAQGVIPLAKSTKIEVPDWANTAAATADATPNQFTVPVTTAANGLVPDIGVSDVEPKLFTGINVEFGLSELTSAQLATLTVKSWTQLAEGIVTTKAVDDTTVLNNNFIREALAGHYDTWEKADGSSDPIIIIRRVEGSGTQAAFNSYFHGFPNTKAFNGYGQDLPAVTNQSYGYDGAHAGTKADPIIIDPAAGFTVFEGSGSGDVRKALQAAQRGVDTGPLLGRENKYYNITFSTVGGPSKAIGVLSLDSYTSVSTAATRAAAVPVNIDGRGYASGNADANGEWTVRFLNGNGTFDVKNQVVTSATSSGVAPSRVNLLNNNYDFTVEPTLQYRTSTTGYKVAFFNTLVSLLGNPADIEIGSPNNGAPLAYVALPTLYTKTATGSTRLVADLTRQGNTTAPLHVKQ